MYGPLDFHLMAFVCTECERTFHVTRAEEQMRRLAYDVVGSIDSGLCCPWCGSPAWEGGGLT